MINFSRIGALVTKEIKDISKNKNVLIMMLMPVGFVILYKFLFVDRLELSDTQAILYANLQVLTLCISMSLVMISGSSSAMMIAEEKEKKTLRILLLAGVTPLEFFFGKLFFNLLICSSINLFIYLYLGLPITVGLLAPYLLVSTLIALVLNLLGALIGVIAPNQMSTGVMGLPLLIGFLLLPMFATMSSSFEFIAQFIPVRSMNIILEGLFTDQFYGNIRSYAFDFTVIISWLVIGLLVFRVAYKRLIAV